MCGIAGIVCARPDVDARPCDVITRMVDTMVHRGPDERGIFADADVALGSCRLAVIDLENGRQPIANEDGNVTVVHNGEIYNFEALRRELEAAGHRFRTRSDTEVIVHAYEQWGRDCVRRFAGMFAFAVHDRRVRGQWRLLLARDRFGIKPLYYYAGDGVFAFASEVRTLLASRIVPRRIDRRAVWDYLGYQSAPAPRTLVENVRMLEPGHWLDVTGDGSVSSACYWNLADYVAEADAPIDASAALTHVRQRLEESVARHLISDVPVGVWLSGGLDSAAVLALARRAGASPTAFTVVLDGMAPEESAGARETARALDTELVEIGLTPDAECEQVVAALAAMDQPTGDGVNTYIIARAVRARGAKVALSGLGGDELFGGYPSFSRIRTARRALRMLEATPSSIRRAAARVARSIRRPASEKIATILEDHASLPAAYSVLRQVFTPAQRHRLLDARWLEAIGDDEDPYSTALAATDTARADRATMAAITLAESRTYMHDVLLRDTDQMSMAHGLEVRVPLLDHSLAEYVVSLPDEIKLAGRWPKGLLLESVRGLLPETVGRRPKSGFVLPFDRWMRGPLRSFCELRLTRLGSRGVVRPDTVSRLWTDYLDGQPTVSWSRPWTLVVLDEWLERNGVA